MLAACAAGLLGAVAKATGQEAKRTTRIGWLGVGTESTDGAPSIALDALRAGLRARGWVEGDNLTIEQRSGTFANAHELAAQLVQSNVRLIVAEGGMIFRVLAASESTPLLFNINGDPVEAGLVASYARPGGNRTGTTSLSAELSAKRVEYLRDAMPHIRKIAAICNQGHPGWPVEQKATQAAASRLGMDLTWLPAFSPADIAASLDAVSRAGAEGIVAVPDNLILGQARSFADFAAKRGIPAISGFGAFAEAGNLMSYGPVLKDIYFKLGTYADKVLRGAKPADLPVENPDRFELVINRRAANAFRVPLPQSLLVRADRIID